MAYLDSIKEKYPKMRLHSILWDGCRSRIFSIKNLNSCIYLLAIGKDLYVGSSGLFNQRAFQHFNMLSNNRHTSDIVQGAYNKHKIASIWILEEMSHYSELTRLEQDYINQLHPSLNKAPAAITGVRKGEETERFKKYFRDRTKATRKQKYNENEVS